MWNMYAGFQVFCRIGVGSADVLRAICDQILIPVTRRVH